MSKGFLKEKMGSYRVSPPASVWKGISGRLGGRNRRSIVLIVLAAAASVALALSLGIHYFGRDLSPEPGLAETSVSHAEQGEDQSQESEAMAILPGENVLETEDPGEQEESLVQTDQQKPDLELAVFTESPTTQDSPFVDDHPGVEEMVVDEAPALTNKTFVAEVPEEESSRHEPATLELDQATAQQLLAEQAAVLETGLEPEPEVAQEKDPRWMLGAALSPLYSFRDAENQYINPEYNHESGHLSYAGGIQVAYRTTRRLALETGVFFNKMGIDIGSQGIQLFSKDTDMAPMYGWEEQRSAYKAISNSVGNIVSESGEVYVNSYMVNASENQLAGEAEMYATPDNMEQGISQHLDYLEIPFNLRYTVVDRAIRLQLVGGLSTNLLVNNYVTMDTPGGRTEIGYMSNVRNVNYSGNAGIGLAYDFLGHFSFSLEPRFRYFLNSVNDATLPTTRPYTLGIYTGLSYIF